MSAPNVCLIQKKARLPEHVNVKPDGQAKIVWTNVNLPVPYVVQQMSTFVHSVSKMLNWWVIHVSARRVGREMTVQ